MEKELKSEAKKLSAQEQYELRKQIIRLHKKNKTAKEIADLLDISASHVYGTISRYKKKGITGITPKHEGRKHGEKRTLTPEQEKEIQNMLIDKNPKQMKIEGCLWTRKRIQLLIKNMYKINMPLSTLSYYLGRWGFSVQRPVKRAYKQNEAHVKKWMEEEYPAIKEQAKAEKGEIFWSDETGIQNTANYARGYAPKGKTPVLFIETAKFKINMISAITNRGLLRFMLYRDNMNQEKLIKFMKRLVSDSDKKVFLILDNLKVHHGKQVTAWLANKKDKIEVFYLPSYSPECNPDEYLNNDLKQNLGNRAMARSVSDIEKQARSFLKKIQVNKEHIKKYFLHNSVKYTA